MNRKFVIVAVDGQARWWVLGRSYILYSLNHCMLKSSLFSRLTRVDLSAKSGGCVVSSRRISWGRSTAHASPLSRRLAISKEGLRS